MKLMLALLGGLLVSVAAQAKTVKLEKRCGWLDNPTPANYWLDDADASWTISAQGGYQAEGMENMPVLDPSEFVETNGSYDYACVCLNVTTDKRRERIGYIAGGYQQPLSVCRADKNLEPR